MESQAIRIGNLITKFHEVNNHFYSTKEEKRKAIRNVLKEIYNSGYVDGLNGKYK